MKRRDFIKRSSLASGLFFVPNFIKNIESKSLNNLGFKKLVIIQLSRKPNIPESIRNRLPDRKYR